MRMRIAFGLQRTVRTCLATLSVLACSGPDSGDTLANSQTGSPSDRQCVVDADCKRDLTGWTDPLGSVELVGAACEYEDFGAMLQPACNCQLRKTPFSRSGDAEAPYVFSAWAGTRPGGCSAYGRVEGCIYCESEFPGCSVDDPASCDAVCADLAQREAVELARSFAARTRATQCTEDYECVTVLEVEGKCYVGGVGVSEPRAYDCAMSDDELLAQPVNAPAGNSCADRSGSGCASADDCPGGLACGDGVCRSCDQACSADNGDACGGSACALGESCAGGACIPNANVTCGSKLDCGAGQDCVGSGIDWSSRRGNESARSFCR